MVPRNKTSLPRLHLMLTHSLPDFECQNKLAMFQTFSALYGKSLTKPWRVLLKYRSFIKFQESPILQGRIHGTELPELGFGHNFQLECTSDLRKTFLSCILRALFRDTPLAHLPCHLAQGTWHLEIQVPGACTWHLAHHQNLARGVPEKNFQNAVQESFFQVASSPQSKFMAKT